MEEFLGNVSCDVGDIDPIGSQVSVHHICYFLSVTFVKLLNRNNSHRKVFVLVWSVETQQFAGPYSQLTAVGSGLNENLQTVGSDLQDLIGLGIGLHEPGKTNTQQKQWF